MAAIDRKETMWATMVPDVYGGKNADKLVPRWDACADGEEGSFIHDALKLDPRTFPPGTKVVISEPVCPTCDEPREPHTQAKKNEPIFSGPCRCGFDWDKWVLEQYS